MPKFKIYSSSAGSGKTYTLTKEYLKLALQSDEPSYFRHILAITFTNDAANEMKARIVKVLRSFAYPEMLSDKERRDSEQLLQTIADETGLPTATIRSRATQTFRKIVYNYTDFAVSTIDSFVNAVISAFTYELNIPHNYEIDLDTAQLMRNTIQRLLEKVGTAEKPELSKTVVRWAIDRVMEGKAWSKIGRDLAEFAQQELTNERSYRYVNKIKKLQLSDYEVIKSQIDAYLLGIEQQIIHEAHTAQNLLITEGLTAQDFYQSTRGIGVFFEKKALFDPKNDKRELLLDLGNNYVKKAIEEDIWYSTPKKASADKIAIQARIDAIAPRLRECYERIAALIAQEQESFVLTDLIQQYLYQISLIQEIEQELEAFKRENNLIHISDTNKKIAHIIANEPVPFIYERVGEKFHHLLIDEFQDTSQLQWLNLMPLVENNLSENHFNLIVGDAKQAIYLWRGGEMEQLVYLYKGQMERLAEMTEEDQLWLEERYLTLSREHSPAQLNFNFRSTHEVIGFNNAFFQKIVDLYSHDFPLLGEIYDESFQQQIPPANQRTGGHIEIAVAQGKSDEYLQRTLDLLGEAVGQALADGFRLRDIAVLCRVKSKARHIAEYLTAQGYEVISQDSLLVQADERILFLIAWLKVLNHPEDQLARANAWYLFLKTVLKITPEDPENQKIQALLKEDILSYLEAYAVLGYPIPYTQWQQMPLYELIEQMSRHFGLMQSAYKLEYLFRLLDFVLEFQQQKGGSLSEFISFWGENRDSLAINTPERDAIIITTIHKSKGLEYPVVLLPFADWSTTPRTGEKLWVDLPPDKLPQLTNSQTGQRLNSVIVKTGALLENTFLEEQNRREHEKKFIEALNLLYVAFTRAVHRLYVVVKEVAPGKDNISALIFRYLAEDFDLTDANDKPDRFVLKQGQPYQAKAEQADDSHIFWIELPE
ncbi:UvrD-helicase domain-containing protein [Eisenibacter elegans]|uniref:UvrD-helicase domain-containing protein n=1 Tax=Eisenibacter elegans TaxID=997 RepID=UPI00047D9A8E|nr:UvrD-helicase domain-containing protein [Eisenibacter elegans]